MKTVKLKKTRNNSSSTPKLNIICGDGEHRSWTGAFAEVVLILKYGNQPNYFWRSPSFSKEYLDTVKICGKLGKLSSRQQLFGFICSEKTDIIKNYGLAVWQLKNNRYLPQNEEEFFLNLKNKLRPKASFVENVEIKKPLIEKQNIKDFLGDI